MRTVLLANNRLGADVGRYLADRGDLVGLVVHPQARRRCGTALAGLEVPTWEWPDGFEAVRDVAPDCVFSVLFGYRVPPAWLELPRWRAVNLHPSLLPWNAGCHPNAWPLVDGSPAGTTLHVMEPAFDTGAILAQEQVPTYPDDTARSLYQRLEAASLLMVRRVWPGIETVEPRSQSAGGSYHRLNELASLGLDAGELHVLDKLRARSFPPHGLEFERDGQRYRARVEIERLD
jgi:methionyl-tRNA formyltransferase